MKIGVILQARMGSTRLPGKTLRPILSQPMIHFVIERLKQMHLPDVFILAVPDGPQDDLLKEIAQNESIEFFTGSESDVLDRYYRAADHFQLDHIYRATGDNPFIEAKVQDRLIASHLAGGYEYSENFLQLPHGLGGEVFSANGLKKCWELSIEDHQREGVNDFILENRGLFSVGHMSHSPYSSLVASMDWTVDTLEEFNRAKAAFETLYESNQSLEIEKVAKWFLQKRQ